MIAAVVCCLQCEFAVVFFRDDHTKLRICLNAGQ